MTLVRVVEPPHDTALPSGALSFRIVLSDNSGVAHALEHMIFHADGPSGSAAALAVAEPALRLNARTEVDSLTFFATSADPQLVADALELFLCAAIDTPLDDELLARECFSIADGGTDHARIVGSVFHEMKADYYKTQRRLEVASDALLAGVEGFDPGGDPGLIAKITGEDVAAFRTQFLTRLNARILCTPQVAELLSPCGLDSPDAPVGNAAALHHHDRS